MPVIIPNDHAQVTQEFFLTGIPKAMAITYAIQDNGSVAGANSLASLCRNVFYGSVWNAVPRGSNWTLGPCKVNYRTPGGSLVTGQDNTMTPGTGVTSQGPPANCAVLIKKITGAGGRENRGRMFCPMFLLAETNIDSAGVIDTATTAVLQGWFTTWFDAMITADLEMQILHQTSTPATGVQGLYVDPRLATQRRRMR